MSRQPEIGPVLRLMRDWPRDRDIASELQNILSGVLDVMQAVNETSQYDNPEMGVDSTSHPIFTPLVYALIHGESKAALLLLKNGAQAGSTFAGDSYLQFAIANHIEIDVLDELIRAGAIPYAGLFQTAIMFHRDDVIEVYGERYPELLSQREEEKTAFEFAISSRSYGATKKLI